MKFFVAPFESHEGDETVTFHCIDTGSNSRKTNRKKLTAYFLHMGVKPRELKSVFKRLGFTGQNLGTVK